MDLQLQRFLDRQKIENTLIAYCIHLDRMDLNALSDLFTEDCIVDYGNDPRLKSSSAASLAKSLERMWRWQRTSHHLSNVVVEFDKDEIARATSYVVAWHERADGSTAIIMGQYHDRLVRRADKWLIAERRMVMNGSDAGFSVPINTFERLPPPDGWTAPEQLDNS